MFIHVSPGYLPNMRKETLGAFLPIDTKILLNDMRKVDQVEKEGVENEYGSDQVKE